MDAAQREKETKASKLKETKEKGTIIFQTELLTGSSWVLLGPRSTQTQAAECRWTQLRLARRAVSALACPPPPGLPGIFLHSRESRGSGAVASCLSATKRGSQAAVVLIYLRGPGSTRGWHKSCPAVPVWLAETSKSGAGRTSRVPSDAHRQPPQSPHLPTDQSRTPWQGLLLFCSSSPTAGLLRQHCNT